ncbi:MAG: hypothetical protein C0501_30370 [Isosphaera sp.]|nr:hypothetical protein [Isosphaera sp.]
MTVNVTDFDLSHPDNPGLSVGVKRRVEVAATTEEAGFGPLSGPLLDRARALARETAAARPAPAGCRVTESRLENDPHRPVLRLTLFYRQGLPGYFGY